MTITHDITLDVSRAAVYGCSVQAKQGDKDSRKLRVHLTDNGVDYQIPAGATASYRVRKPDGHIVDKPATVNSDGTVTVTLSDQVLAVAGTCLADVVLKESGTILSTASFILIVGAVPYGDALDSNDDFVLLTTSAATAKAAAERAEAASTDAVEAAKHLSIDKSLMFAGQAADSGAAGAQIRAIRETLETAKMGRNAVDDAKIIGTVVDDDFIRYISTNPGDPGYKWLFPIEPAFDFSHGEQVITNIWFTDGTCADAYGTFAANYRDAQDQPIVIKSVGHATAPDKPASGAKYVRLQGSGPSSSGWDAYRGKTIANLSFTLAEYGDRPQPYTSYKSRRLEHLEQKQNSITRSLDMVTVLGHNAVDDSKIVGTVVDSEFLKYISTNPGDPGYKWLFPIEPVFDFSHGEPVITNIWFTDGTHADAYGTFAANYRDAQNQMIVIKSVGHATAPDKPASGAKYVMLTGSDPKSSAWDAYRGKTIANLSFTLAEYGDRPQTFGKSLESKRLGKIESDIAALQESPTPAQNPFVARYASKAMSAGAETSQFLFFTDPHCWGVNSESMYGKEFGVLKELSAVQDLCSAPDVLCAGDWLNWGENLSAKRAFFELSKTHGMTASLFRNYHPAVGNHEFAFYKSGRVLSETQVQNAYMPEYSHLWYSFRTAKHTVIVLNTDENPNAAISPEQKKFLTEQLTAAQTDVIILCHIVYDGDSTTQHISPVYQSILDVLDAYNGRTSPFESAGHKVLCTLAGHMHRYLTHTSATGIVSIAFDKLVDDREGLVHYYGVVIDGSKRKLTAVQNSGSDLVYDLPAI